MERRPDVIINMPQPLLVVARILKAMPDGAYVTPGERSDQMFVFFKRPEGGNDDSQATESPTV